MRLRPGFGSPLVLGAALALAACGVDQGRGDGGNGNPQGSNPDLTTTSQSSVDGGPNNAGTDDMNSIDPGNPNDNNTCQELTFTPTKVGDPDIVLLQDISGSMSDGMPSKYSQVESAMSNVINQLAKQNAPIDWGMFFFPNNGDCGVATIPDVPVSATGGPAVVSALQSHSPNGNTPLQTAVMNGTSYYNGLKDGRGHYFVVATDGQPNCDGGSGLPKSCKKDSDCAAGETCMMVPFIGGLCGGTGSGAVSAVAAARMAGIKTFVVGIDLDSSSTSTLNMLADAGGTAQPGMYHYFPVANQMALEMALSTITSQIISCSFALSSLPMSTQMIDVSIGGTTISQDTTHMNGWDIDTATKSLTFYGKACMQLQTSPATVSVDYSCPPPG